MKKPMFSVIVPAYNCEKYIEKAIRSVASQDYEHKEVIVVNDGSKDKTLEIAQRMAAEYSCVKVIDQENHGMCRSRNKAQNMAVGDYVLFLDADDWYEPDAMQLLAEQLEKEEVDLLYYNIRKIDKYRVWNQRIKKYPKGQYSRIEDPYIIVRMMLDFADMNFIYIGMTVWSTCYRREFLVEHSLENNPDHHIGEDLMFNLNCLRHNPRLGYLSKTLYNYDCNNASSATSRFRSDILDACDGLLVCINEHLNKYYPDDDVLQYYLEIWCYCYLFMVLRTYRHRSFEEFEDIYEKTIRSKQISRVLKYKTPRGRYKYIPQFYIFTFFVRHRCLKAIKFRLGLIK